jgi:hypothetical protein
MIGYFAVAGVTGVAGVVAGILGHAFLAKEEGATIAEIKNWRSRLKEAAIADATTAKQYILTLVEDIEKKL